MQSLLIKTLFISLTTNLLLISIGYSQESRFTSWAIEKSKSNASIRLQESIKHFKQKKNVVVAVIDTGIDYNHPHLKNNIYVQDGNLSNLNFGKDFSKKRVNNMPTDFHGHGTHIAGIIKSVFPNVLLLPLKYYNPSATEDENLESTINALEYAISAGVDIINYSGGGPVPNKKEYEVLKKAQQKGILIIAAAGNYSSNIDNLRTAFYPASYNLNNIITVGAHNQQNQLIKSSNWGLKSVDIVAPGENIKSSVPANGSAYMTGTSQATAFVTGVAALVKANFPKMSYKQVRGVILASAQKVNSLKNKIYRSGKLDAEKALILANAISKKKVSKPRKLASNQ